MSTENTFFDRIPQKPLRLILHEEPSIKSKERLPEKTPIVKAMVEN